MTATDVTGFDAVFSTGFFATFSRFWGARLTKLHREPGEKAKNPVESLQWRRRPPKLQISVPCRGRTCPDDFSRVQIISWMLQQPQGSKAAAISLNRAHTKGLQNIHPHPPHLENAFWAEMGGRGGGGRI